MDATNKERQSELETSSWEIADVSSLSSESLDKCSQAFDAMRGPSCQNRTLSDLGFPDGNALLNQMHDEESSATKEAAPRKPHIVQQGLEFSITIEMETLAGKTIDGKPPVAAEGGPPGPLRQVLEGSEQGFGDSLRSILEKMEGSTHESGSPSQTARAENKMAPHSGVAEKIGRGIGSVAGQIAGGFIEGCADSQILADRLGLLAESESNNLQKIRQNMRENPLSSVPEVAGYGIGAVAGTAGTIVVGAGSLMQRVDTWLHSDAP